jgi:ribosomal protein L11 methyltransferase
MARLMDKIVRPGSYWIDAGTGTGVLAILADKLGARGCFAFDNNMWSVDNAEENIANNHSADKIELVQLDIDECDLPRADGVAANINTNIVIKSLPKFYQALEKSKGDLIVSGVLSYDREELVASAAKNRFRLIECLGEDEWIGCHFKPEG